MTRLLSLLLVLHIAVTATAQTLVYRDRKPLEGDWVGGLSGITHGQDRLYYAVNDHPPAAVSLAIQVRDDGSLQKVQVVKIFPLPDIRDAEAVAAFGKTQMFVTDESHSRLWACEMPLTARRLHAVAVPKMFENVVQNQGLESLCVSRDGASLWIANERALPIDGNPIVPATPMFSTTRVRLQRFDLDAAGKATPAEQFEYETSGVHDIGGQIGLCDLASLPDGRLLALERSAAQNFSGASSIRTRVFLVDTAGATDIGKPPFDQGLAGASQPPVKVKKELLWEGFVHDENGENVEGICLGEELGDGRWAVLGVVDGGDGGLRVSSPAVVSWELNLNPAPATRPATAPIRSP